MIRPRIAQAGQDVDLGVLGAPKSVLFLLVVEQTVECFRAGSTGDVVSDFCGHDTPRILPY